MVGLPNGDQEVFGSFPTFYRGVAYVCDIILPPKATFKDPRPALVGTVDENREWLQKQFVNV